MNARRRTPLAMNFREARMSMRTSSVCLLLLAFCLLPMDSNAQIKKKAQVGFRFLENPVSAEVIGRGTVGVTSTLNANGIFWNPSLLGWIDSDVDLTLNHTRGIAEINYNSAAAAIH